MKTASFILIIFIVNALNLNAQCDKGWFEQISGTPDGEIIISGTVDNNGFIYVGGGYVGSAINFDTVSLIYEGISMDACIAKYDSMGNALWARKFVGSGDDLIYDVIAVENNNIIVFGQFTDSIIIDTTLLISNGTQNLFLAKFDENGSKIWVKQIAGTYLSASAIDADIYDNVYLTGSFFGTVNFDTIGLTDTGGSSDIFIAKYNPQGSVIWSKNIGGQGFGFSSDIVVDKNSNFYITGAYIQNITFDTINLLSDSVNNFEIFIAKYDSNGNAVWAKKGEGPDTDFGFGITVDPSGNSYITGTFWQDVTFDTITLISKGLGELYVTKYDSTGNVLWAIRGGGKWGDGARRIMIKDNSLYLAGEFGDTADFGTITLIGSDANFSDIFILKIDTSGNVLCAKQAGDTLNDNGNIIGIDNQENIYVLGGFVQSIILNSDTFTSTGGGDNFIWKTTLPDSPKANFSYSFSNLTLNLSDSSINACTYLWSFGDGDSAGTQDPSHTYLSEGIYNVCLVASNSCGTDTICDSITVMSTGIENFANKSTLMMVYPNPFDERTTITYAISDYSQVNLLIHSYTGQHLTTLVNEEQGKGSYEIDWDTTDIAPGIYFYTLKVDGVEWVKKAVKIK